MRRLSAILFALAFTGSAQAGGIGIIGTGSVRTHPTYYYDTGAELQQYKLTQMIPGGGAGIEIILGDRDDKLVGLFRGYWLREAPEAHPRDLNTPIDSGDVLANVREGVRDVGMAMVGLDWAFYGDPQTFTISGIGLIGSGFLTTDKTEYFQLELGPGVSWEFARRTRLTGNIAYQMRYRKNFDHGVSGYVGVRYMFD